MVLPTTQELEFCRLEYNTLRVQTLTDRPKSATLPRICFKCRLPFQESDEMMRIQFPLRLAYAMTYHKCQGQTMKKVLLDISNPPLPTGTSPLHSHMSEQIYENAPVINNATTLN
jgi:hypothetical protein